MDDVCAKRADRAALGGDMDGMPLDRAFFDRLTDNSFEFLSQYYRQTERHANRAFVAALVMAVFGGVVVVAGVIAAFLRVGDASYVAVGCGVIGEFLASVLFALYYKTVANMKKYHNALLKTLDLAIALKTADSLDGGADDAKLLVIQSVMRAFAEREANAGEATHLNKE